MTELPADIESEIETYELAFEPEHARLVVQREGHGLQTFTFEVAEDGSLTQVDGDDVDEFVERLLDEHAALDVALSA